MACTKTFATAFKHLSKNSPCGKSLAVVPVCDALAVIARSHGSKETHVLRDISLLNRGEPCTLPCDLRAEAKISAEDVVILYIGNLERYQGIGLLLESFARVTPRMEHTALVIIGGRTDHIDEYLKLSEQLGVSSRVHFLGPRPVSTARSISEASRRARFSARKRQQYSDENLFVSAFRQSRGCNRFADSHAGYEF